LDDNSHEFRLIAVINLGLLRAVVADKSIVELDDLDERRLERYEGHIRTSFGRGKKLRVLLEQPRVSAVMALAEEVSFANGLVREGHKEGQGRRREEQS
jgi:hypothetical protein